MSEPKPGFDFGVRQFDRLYHIVCIVDGKQVFRHYMGFGTYIDALKRAVVMDNKKRRWEGPFKQEYWTRIAEGEPCGNNDEHKKNR